MIYKAGKRTGVEKDKFIHINPSTGTYFIDDFNVKIKVAILQQRKFWEPAQFLFLSKLSTIYILTTSTIIYIYIYI